LAGGTRVLGGRERKLVPLLLVYSCSVASAIVNVCFSDYGSTERYVNQYRMSSKQKRVSYSVAFKLNVIKFTKEHGSRAAERHFGPCPTKKMIHAWRKQEEESLKPEKISILYAHMLQNGSG
jgi:hypothetical protein